MTRPPRCPICQEPVLPESPAPFCSSRCRTIDLGQWLGGRYVIAGERHVDERAVPGADDDER
jgi:endogenous inhibitor of DNA gyrase (YacG/DUF329 family)